MMLTMKPCFLQSTAIFSNFSGIKLIDSMVLLTPNTPTVKPIEQRMRATHSKTSVSRLPYGQAALNSDFPHIVHHITPA